MAWCLTPSFWSPHPERRISGLRGPNAEARQVELRDRLATWKAWVDDLGGRSFVESAAAPCVYILGTLDGGEDGKVVVHDREEAFRLLASLRERGIDATLSVRRRRR